MNFRNDIQGLRAVAFFLVFIFHLNKNWLPGGYLGVDLFFVISGYLVTSIIRHNIELDKFSFINFFIKRVKRILPAYLFLLFVVSFSSLYFYLYLDIGTIRGTLFRSAIFISNHIFAGGENYFGAKMSENPLLHTWSLAVEMQFYIILPIILYYFRRNIKFVLIILILLFTLYSSINIFYFDQQNQMYFSLIARIPEFLVGALMSVIFKNRIDFSRQKNNIFALGSSIVFLSCAYFISEDYPFPGYLALIPTFAAGFILVLDNNIITDLLAKKWLVHFGELSFSLYLFHWPIMAIIRYRFDDYFFDFKMIIFICVITYFLAWFSYTFVERKFREQSDSLFFKILIPTYLVFLILCFFMPKIASRNKIPMKFASIGIGAKSHDINFVDKLGDQSKNDSIVLIGDSHALSLKPFFDDIGKRYNFSFYTISRNAYPPISGIDQREIPFEKRKHIETTNALINTAEKLIKNNKIIIVSSIGFDRLPSLSKCLNNLVSQIKPDQKLILIATFPQVDKDPIKLNNGFIKENPYQFTKIESEQNKLLLLNIAKKYSNVFVYDISKSKIFKNAPYINDTIAYFDAKHINEFGALKLSNDLNKDFMIFFQNIKNK